MLYPTILSYNGMNFQGADLGQEPPPVLRGAIEVGASITDYIKDAVTTVEKITDDIKHFEMKVLNRG